MLSSLELTPLHPESLEGLWFGLGFRGAYVWNKNARKTVRCTTGMGKTLPSMAFEAPSTKLMKIVHMDFGLLLYLTRLLLCFAGIELDPLRFHWLFIC